MRGYVARENSRARCIVKKGRMEVWKYVGREEEWRMIKNT